MRLRSARGRSLCWVAELEGEAPTTETRAPGRCNRSCRTTTMTSTMHRSVVSGFWRRAHEPEIVVASMRGRDSAQQQLCSAWGSVAAGTHTGERAHRIGHREGALCCAVRREDRGGRHPAEKPDELGIATARGGKSGERRAGAVRATWAPPDTLAQSVAPACRMSVCSCLARCGWSPQIKLLTIGDSGAWRSVDVTAPCSVLQTVSRGVSRVVCMDRVSHRARAHTVTAPASQCVLAPAAAAA